MGSRGESSRTVADVLGERAARADGERADDGAKVALVVEGGGMRGSISAEMVAELADRGIVDLVDIVVGTSAGAVNAVATAAGVIDTVAATYSDVFASPKFASPYRALRLKPMVDTSAIVDEMDRRTSFARIAFEAPRIDFALVATDVEATSTVTLDNFSDRDDVCRSITASATLPFMGGRPVRHRGRRLLDGGIMEAVPIAAAKNLGRRTPSSSSLARRSRYPCSAEWTDSSPNTSIASTRRSDGCGGGAQTATLPFAKRSRAEPSRAWRRRSSVPATTIACRREWNPITTSSAGHALMPVELLRKQSRNGGSPRTTRMYDN